MVNYNNSMIYQICCKDTNIKEVYIGSTVNFKSRKSQHKSMCNNPKGKKYHLKLYQFIRAMGGWENWDMVLIDTVSCENKLELHKIERQYIEDTKLTLNCKIPSRSVKEYYEEKKAQCIDSYFQLHSNDNLLKFNYFEPDSNDNLIKYHY